MFFEYFLQSFDLGNAFCHLGWQDLPLFPPLKPGQHYVSCDFPPIFQILPVTLDIKGWLGLIYAAGFLSIIDMFDCCPTAESLEMWRWVEILASNMWSVMPGPTELRKRGLEYKLFSLEKLYFCQNPSPNST